MIPYFPPQEWRIGPLPIHLFGILVATGILVGNEICLRRAKKMGLDAVAFSGLVFWMMLFGFIGAHWAAVLFYDWPILREKPWLFLQIWNGISSMGGFLGAFVTVFFYLRAKKLPLWPYSDVIAYALPFGWFFGRLGCASAHDHPGRPSDFFLAIAYPGGARHDLGFYEMLFSALICIFFWTQRNRPRPVGFYLVSLLLFYPPIRFGLDFLRVSDQTYFGLTFAQYTTLPLFAVGAWQIRRLFDRERYRWPGSEKS